MRKRIAYSALLISAAFTAGCLSGFRHPLGSVRESFIDGPLLGAWVCSSNDDEPKRIDLSFMQFDARQYLLQSDDQESEPYSHRVIATRIEAATFLSLRSIAPKADDEWTILQYAFDDDHLSIKLVDPQPFEDVVDDPAAVRDRLAGRLDDSEVIMDLWSCARPPAEASGSEPQ